MKNLRKMVMLILTLAMLTTGVQVSVLADQTTDLQSMKVYAVNAAGKRQNLILVQQLIHMT